MGSPTLFMRGLLPLRRRLKTGSRRGQAMLEYTLVAGMLLASVAILAVFLYTFKEIGGRTLELVASEYP